MFARTDPAAKQGIRRGDILVGMHIWETITSDNVNYILDRPDFATLEPVKFYIVRARKRCTATSASPQHAIARAPSGEAVCRPIMPGKFTFARFSRPPMSDAALQFRRRTFHPS